MRIKKFDKYDILVISWQDITQDAEWHDKEKLKNAKAADVKSIGFFLDNKKKVLRISHSVAEDGDCDVMCIPWGTISKIKDINFTDKGTDGTTPTAGSYMYRKLAVADTAEALDLGDVSTVTCIVIRAVTNDLDVDLDYSAAFDKDFTLAAGEIPAVIPTPVLVYVKNNGAGEAPVYEYLVIGTT
jgi:hypothetical protein